MGGASWPAPSAPPPSASSPGSGAAEAVTAEARMEEDELDLADELEAALQLAPEVQLAIEQVKRRWSCQCVPLSTDRGPRFAVGKPCVGDAMMRGLLWGQKLEHSDRSGCRRLRQGTTVGED